MTTWTGRLLVAVAVAPSIVLMTALAPEHVHEADGSHSHAVVHRHLEFHDHGDADDHDGAEVSHGEDHVVWLINVALQQTTYVFPVPQSIAQPSGDVAPALTRSIRKSVSEGPPAHGPPPRSSTSLRAPPFPVLRLT